MKESLEEKYSLDAVTIMEKQSIMLFNAREEVCKLHEALEKERNVSRTISEGHAVLSDRNDCLKSGIEYACRMFNYVCSKQKVLIFTKELEEALGKMPEDVTNCFQELRRNK